MLYNDGFTFDFLAPYRLYFFTLNVTYNLSL